MPPTPTRRKPKLDESTVFSVRIPNRVLKKAEAARRKMQLTKNGFITRAVEQLADANASRAA